MSEKHIPVMKNEVLSAASTCLQRPNLVFFDGTYGRGGHFRELWKLTNWKKAIINDQDQRAIELAKIEWNEEIQNGKIEISAQNFFQYASNSIEKLDFILLDLGVSSPQLDQAERGFSFNKDGPLDMRMNQNLQRSAQDVLQTADEQELNHIFKTYGEIERPGRVIRAILNDRIEKPFTSTLQFAGLIERIEGWKKKGFHPATQYFMALRLEVNQELQVIEEGIPLFLNLLQDGGRIAVITFHSLEDRIVKNLFKENELGFALNKKVIVPTDEECKINPRARSAKLRVFQKGKPPEKPDKFELRRQQLRGSG